MCALTPRPRVCNDSTRRYTDSYDGVAEPLVTPSRWLRVILRVTDLLHPFYDFAIELFLNSNVSHRCAWRRAVPVFLVRCKPNDIAGPDLFNRASFPLHPSASGGHDQRLT